MAHQPNAHNTLKKRAFSSSFLKAKQLSFSVLMASSQRNTHFCGCKGTKNLWNMKAYSPSNPLFYEDLTIE